MSEIYCLCGSLDINDANLNRMNIVLNEDYRDYTVQLKTPVKCIKTGARRYQIETGGIRFSYSNVDVFECPDCGRKVCK